MDVKRCDRCGAIYEVDNSTYNRTDFIIVNEPTAQRNRRNTLRYNGDCAVAYDVCKHCMASFKYWFTIKDDNDE